jgi:hypothetical protein
MIETHPYDDKPLKATEGQTTDIKLRPPKLEIQVGWPPALIAQLPDDLVLRLQGTEVSPIEIPVGEAERVGDQIAFRFGWDEADRPTTLEAEAGGETVVLWKDQVLKDGKAPEWSGQLESLAKAHPAYEYDVWKDRTDTMPSADAFALQIQQTVQKGLRGS